MTTTPTDLARRTPEEVDVERLARAIYDSYASCWLFEEMTKWEDQPSEIHHTNRCRAEAALADLTAQGFSVARREDLALATGWYEVGDPGVMDERDKAAYDRLRVIEDAAFATPGQEP